MKVSTNFTISSLSLSSLSRSPYFSLSDGNSPFKFTIQHSKFNKFGSSLLRSLSSSANILLRHSTVANFLDTSVYVDTVDKFYRENIIGRNQNENLGLMADAIACQEMIFINCTTEHDGGAVFVVIGGDFYCNFTAFQNCYTRETRYGGAMYCIANTTNFTGSCFQNCAATRGSCYYNPETSFMNSNELCQFNDISPAAAYNAYLILEIYARDVIITGSNISNVNLQQGLKITPTQNMQLNNTNFERFTIANSADSSSIVFQINQVNPQMQFRHCNLITSTSDYVFSFQGFQAIISDWVFSGSTINQYFVNAQSGFRLTLGNSTCDFSQDKVSDAASDIQFTNDNNNFGAADIQAINFDVVSTVGCWAHSTYKWSRPSTGAQAGVLAFMVVAILIACVVLFIHKKYLDSKAPKEEDDEDENEDVDA